MAPSKQFFILFVIFGLVTYATAKKWVTYRGSYEKNLIFPNDIPYNVHDLYLDNNLIETVDSIDLNFTSLVYLNLSHNIIFKVSPEAFINVRQLKVLDLSYNKILGTLFTTATFKKLESLELLVLKGNPLGIIKNEVFPPTYFSKIQYAIDFSACSIHTIEPNSLVYMDKLTRLDLSRNNLSKLHPDTFLGLNGMKRLNLSHNLLDRVSTRMFNYLNVSVIDLSSNKISILEDGCFSKINQLQSLNLSDNRVATQPKDQFGDRFLGELDLSKNLFDTFDTSLLSVKVRKYLRILRISNSTKLERIVAGKGRDGHAEGLENLEKLYLNNNVALTYIEPAAFSSASKTLRVAHISNTRLEEIPDGLIQWENLTTYSISTPNLKCDCHTKWMLDETQFDRSKAHLTCGNPPIYRGINLFHINREHLVCSSHSKLMVLAGIMGLLLVIIVMVLFTYWLRYKKRCPTCGRRHANNGKYVSVYSKDIDEPVTRIIDEKVYLVSATDV